MLRNIWFYLFLGGSSRLTGMVPHGTVYYSTISSLKLEYKFFIKKYWPLDQVWLTSQLEITPHPTAEEEDIHKTQSRGGPYAIITKGKK